MTSISAFYILRGRHLDFAKRSFLLALFFGAVSCVLIGMSGHSQASRVAITQPAKLATMEGHFRTGPADLYVLGIPDDKQQTVHLGLAIPGGLSFLLTGDWSHSVPGRDAFRPEDLPPVALTFYSYHLMVGMGVLLTALSLLAVLLWWRGTLFEQRWLLWLFVFAVAAPIVANQTGWIAAEVGRQPFIVYPEVRWDGDRPILVTDGDKPGLRTEVGLSSRKVVGGEQVLTSILMFGFVYSLLFVLYLYILNSKIQHGPDEHEEPPPSTTPSGLLEAAAQMNPAGGQPLYDVAPAGRK